MRDRTWLIALLLSTFVLSAIWAFIVPTSRLGFQPDEGSHFAVIQFMATNHGALPPYRMGYDTSVHPPLYHESAALLYSIVFPVGGESGGLVAVRMFSALLGTGTVYAVYLLARQTRLSRSVAIPTAMLAAFIPMRVSLAGAATNENLAALGSTASLLVLYAGARRGFSLRRILLLSFWTVIAVGSKVTCLGLLPAIAVCVLLARCPGQPWGRTFVIALSPVVSVLGCLGWWFLNNIVRYGDPLRKAAADRLWSGVQPGFAVISERTGMPAWRYLISISVGGWFSFWGQFNGMQYRLPYGIYASIFVLQLISIWGIVVSLRRPQRMSRSHIAIGGAVAVLCAWVFLIYTQYNWLHYTPQGRYFFVLVGPITLFITGGMHRFLGTYVPDKSRQQLFWWGAGVLLIALNLYTLWAMPRTIGLL